MADQQRPDDWSQADAHLYAIRNCLGRLAAMDAEDAPPDQAVVTILLVQVASHTVDLDRLLSGGGELPAAWQRSRARGQASTRLMGSPTRPHP